MNEPIDKNEPSEPAAEHCWECGQAAECSEHFIPCAGAVVRLCDDCREAAVRRNLPDAQGRRTC